jgi:hypothetical protein
VPCRVQRDPDLAPFSDRELQGSDNLETYPRLHFNINEREIVVFVDNGNGGPVNYFVCLIEILVEPLSILESFLYVLAEESSHKTRLNNSTGTPCQGRSALASK